MKEGYLIRAFRHFKTITTHKIIVMKLLFKTGLYYQGITHDLSKYSFSEFLSGVKYYQGFKSPNSREKELFGYSKAWLHHKGRNRHHFEYWIDYGLTPNNGLVGNKMPLKYLIEMVCDKIAASKVYNKDKFSYDIPYNYFIFKEKGVLMHEDTRRMLLKLLIIYKDQGEEALIKAMKELLKHPENY